MQHYSLHNFISNVQHGFQKGLGCDTQLATTVEELQRGLDNKYQHDVVILDFNKAFGKVPHRHLLKKLDASGIRGNIHKWLTTYLTNRTQRVKPLSQWVVISGYLELTRCKSTVKAICVGLANSTNYPDQWSDATIIRCKLHCERVKLFVSLLGGAAYAAVSREFRSVLHLRFYQGVYGFMSIERAFQIQGFYSFIFWLRLYFKWVIPISGFATMTSRVMAEAMAEMLHDVTWICYNLERYGRRSFSTILMERPA